MWCQDKCFPPPTPHKLFVVVFTCGLFGWQAGCFWLRIAKKIREGHDMISAPEIDLVPGHALF